MIMSFFGMIYFFLRDKIWALYLAVAVVISYGMLILFTNFDIDPRSMSIEKQYFLQMHMVFAIFIGFGYQLLIDLSRLPFRRKPDIPPAV
jgi:hypothetical protein